MNCKNCGVESELEYCYKCNINRSINTFISTPKRKGRRERSKK